MCERTEETKKRMCVSEAGTANEKKRKFLGGLGACLSENFESQG